MAAIQTVTRGQSLASAAKADTWNAFVETANAYRQKGEQPQWEQFASKESPAHTVLVQNDSGAAIEQFQILGISTAALTNTDNLEEFKAHPVLSGITPALSHHGAFVIAARGIPNGERELGLIGGITPVQINVTASNTLFRRADVTTNVSYLTLVPHGSAQVVWIEAGLGTKWAIVRLGNHEGVTEVGKTNSTITPGNAGDISIYRGGVDTGFDVSAYLNWMDAEQVSINKEVLIQWFTGERIWRIVGAECE